MNVTNYNKDALEVPVFEYSCQLDDSDNVIIGENVFDNFETDFRYMYEFVFMQHGKADDKNWNKIIPIKLSIIPIFPCLDGPFLRLQSPNIRPIIEKIVLMPSIQKITKPIIPIIIEAVAKPLLPF